MNWPVTIKGATILGTTGNTTFTAEKPWHGRSGGALVDVDAMVLIGVVQGYEVYPNSRGLYVSHDAILRFLDAHGPDRPGVEQQYSRPRPSPAERREALPVRPPFFAPLPAPGGC